MRRSGIVAMLLFLGVFAWAGCASKDWPVYRYKAARTADQPNASALSDPSRVPGLHQIWEFRPSSVGDPDTVPGGMTSADGFVASPTVYRGKVFVGHRNGRFYALDANTGALIWRYPVPPQAPLQQNYPGNASSPGIASSATIAKVWVPWFWSFKRPVKVVIFGAPDPSVCVGTACGSGRLWALDVDTGALVWKSDVVANLTGVAWGSLTELHERIGYSSPVVANGKVYIGIADNGDSPIQLGRLAAVDLQTGARVGTFSFVSSGLPPGSTALPRGGGIWSSPAASGGTVFVTTGNGCRLGNGCATEPANNHALSMLKLDGSTGGVLWKLQPVPWALDDDPDWAATPLVARTSCGRLTVAPMKDGYTHAVNADTGAVVWSFPFVTGGLPFTYGSHGDWGWTRPAAAWKDVIFAITGGFPITTSSRYDGYNRLYALNACAPYNAADTGRVRWIADVQGLEYTGQPTVTRGIVYVGNSQGQLFAIADPDVVPVPQTQRRCSNPLFSPANCAGFDLVPIPVSLINPPLQLSGSIRTEPVIARGRLYVATTAGRLHALEP